MNDVVSEGLKGITGYQLVGWTLGIFALIAAIIAATIKIYKVVEKYRAMRNELDKKDEMIKQHDTDIKGLKDTDTELIKSINTITDKLDGLSTQISNMQDKQDEQDRARIKDQIRQLYVHCHESQSMTTIEKDTLNTLIKAYENAKGVNSFIHSVVIPEMDLWKVLP